ncbi:MAG: tRNA epoxyqueuosine(34) reductase QueG [Chloroflexi bacterium]|nr:tRNA epoxyqueuosine(34) reductase QueG [Chloroflexota bacterium]MBI3338534.1 tRNA epoxyqueuosine(34) reductase QueG [Chloroflexota bacterium]
MSAALKQAIQNEARRLGFILAGVTTPDPPPHLSVFEDWLMQGRHASMNYLADDRSRARRADPRLILPECKSILVLALPYTDPKTAEASNQPAPSGRVASYAWGDDYHLVIPEKLKALVAFIERQVGHPVFNRWYTDTGPILERELAQRAGLGWIGKNSLLINPKLGSYFLLAEIFLDLELEPDEPFTTDHCGTCRRCIEACPTQCILPNRTIDARRCISYLTIELKEDIPPELRPMLGNWVFGCDICQAACPWNRFAASEHESPALKPRTGAPRPNLIRELELMPKGFNAKFKDSPIKRAKRRGYLRNVAVALGNSKDANALPALTKALDDPEPLVREHATWAIQEIEKKI